MRQRASALQLLGGVVLAAPIIVGVQTASASPAGAVTVTHVREIAGVSPFTGSSCNQTNSLDMSPGGKESEPYIAVSPARPSNRIAAWMDATRATVDAAYTIDGGRTWHVVIPQGIDGCTGNSASQWEGSGSPWVAFGPDGTAFLSTLTWAHFSVPPFGQYVSVVHVQTSRDGGRHWSPPALLSGPDAVADRPMVAADPYHAGTAYEIWRNQAYGLPVGTRRGATRLYFTVTHDHGVNWSTPVTVAAAGPSGFFGNPQLSVLRDGTLVATSSLADAGGGTSELSWRSGDGGRTWRGPALIRVAVAGELAPICGESASAGADSSSASGQQTVAGGRSVLFVTSDGAAMAGGRGALVLSRSDDGGRTWRSWTIFRSPSPIILASVAAGHGGRLGLVLDRIDSGGTDCHFSIIPVRSEFALVSASKVPTVASRPVTLGAQSWNLASGFRGSGEFGGYFLGEYQALAATPDGFTAITVQGRPIAPGGPALTGKNGVIVSNVELRDLAKGIGARPAPSARCWRCRTP